LLFAESKLGELLAGPRLDPDCAFARWHAVRLFAFHVANQNCDGGPVQEALVEELARVTPDHLNEGSFPFPLPTFLALAGYPLTRPLHALPDWLAGPGEHLDHPEWRFVRAGYLASQTLQDRLLLFLVLYGELDVCQAYEVLRRIADAGTPLRAGGLPLAPWHLAERLAQVTLPRILEAMRWQ
jgi:hypothetical protein